MSRKLHIGIVFNEPASISDSQLMQFKTYENTSIFKSIKKSSSIDLSDVGVLEARNQIREVLDAEGFETSIFSVDANIEKLLQYISDKAPDIIFNLCEAVHNVAVYEMYIAGIFELLGVPFTGSGPFTLGLCLQKSLTKQILSFNGIQTPSHQIFHNVEDIPNSKLLDEFPLIVKPSREDASVGIENSSVVYTIDALKKQISKIIREYKQPVLVEQFIEGRELNVAILGNEEPIVLPISEIDFSLLPKNFPKIVTYKAKWVEDSVEYKGTNGKCPADLPLKIQDNVKSIAMRAFSIMNCRDYARVDIRLTSNGTPYVLEINPNPDISIDSGFARSARTFGLEYPQMICKITEVALKRAKVVQ